MCGFAGFIAQHPSTRDGLESLATAMADTLVTRGPDDSGTWSDPAVGVAFGFRRLAIVDLTPEGHQPMRSADGRYMVVFNGEIYNFEELRQELVGAGHRFRGRSDTEVLLAAVSEWGVEAAVRRLNGMFAIALWDTCDLDLWLIRDRMGKKPLYYGWCRGTLLFGSELKALAVHPDFTGEIDRDSLALFMRFSYVPSPFSIYRDIRKLPPASLLRISRGSQAGAVPKAYWSALEAAVAGERNPFQGSAAEATDELDRLLRDAVRMRMVADVPLGAFLSGGIDSSMVVALMQAQSDIPVRTFSIGFEEAEFNEADHASDVARHLGTDHTELYVSPKETLDVIPQLPSIYDEPFADSSQVPTFLVSRLARQHVTVALSGDGGDEVFGGYTRYLWTQRIWNSVRWLPRPLRSVSARVVRGGASRPLAAGIRATTPFLPRSLRVQNPADKLQKLADLLPLRNQQELYSRLISHWKDPQAVTIGSRARATVVDDLASASELRHFVHRMMYIDSVTYLPDDILVKVDRASMAVSLEARAPLLDYRVFEFSWRLPLEMQIRRGTGKWLLRKVLDRYVPAKFVDRPKMGFGIPIGAWLRGRLRDWAEALLDERRLRSESFLNVPEIRGKWEEHVRGERDWQYYLWDVLMFEAWLESTVGVRHVQQREPVGIRR